MTHAQPGRTPQRRRLVSRACNLSCGDTRIWLNFEVHRFHCRHRGQYLQQPDHGSARLQYRQPARRFFSSLANVFRQHRQHQPGRHWACIRYSRVIARPASPAAEMAGLPDPTHLGPPRRDPAGIRKSVDFPETVYSGRAGLLVSGSRHRRPDCRTGASMISLRADRIKNRPTR